MMIALKNEWTLGLFVEMCSAMGTNCSVRRVGFQVRSPAIVSRLLLSLRRLFVCVLC